MSSDQEDFKEVKKEVKNKFLQDIYNSISNNKNPSTISKELNISKQKLNYYIKQLKNKGLIRKIGYAVWEVKKVLKDTSFSSQFIGSSSHTDYKDIRGHAFSWKIKLPNEIKGLNFESKLKSKGIKYKLIGLKNTPRIICLNKKVWLGKNNIIVYDSSSYMGKNAIESRKLAVYRLMLIIQELEKSLNISLKTQNGYQFKPSREHYSIIKNDLAHQYNEQGKRLIIRFHGETWFIIDNSYNLDEAETIHPETALTDSLGIQRYFNQHKELKYEVTPKFILESINQVTNNQLMFAKNLESHVKAMNDISESNKLLQETIKELKELIKNEK